MTDDQKYELAVLAEAAEIAKLNFRCHAEANTPTDPTEAVKARIAYEIAKTEFFEAEAKLNRFIGQVSSMR